MPVLFTLTAADPLLADDSDGSGLQSIEYSLDDGQSWQTYSQPFEIAAVGETGLQYRSVDVAGNVETAKRESILNRPTPPVRLYLPIIFR